MADDHHRQAFETRKATDDGVVVGKGAVAVQFLEIGERQAQIIERVRTLRMARHLGNLPRGQLGIDVLGQGLALLFQARDLIRNVDGGFALLETQRFDLAFEFGDRLFKVEKRGLHRIGTRRTPKRNGPIGPRKRPHSTARDQHGRSTRSA